MTPCSDAVVATVAQSGRHHVCEQRFELGIRGGRPGALAEQTAISAIALHALPDAVDDLAGAMIEPGGNALRSVQAADLGSGERALILGAGTIGLLAAMFARAAGAGVHLMGRSQRSLSFARELGFDGVWTEQDQPELSWDAVIDASNAQSCSGARSNSSSRASGSSMSAWRASPSRIDSRSLVLNDVTAVGILGASALDFEAPSTPMRRVGSTRARSSQRP